MPPDAPSALPAPSAPESGAGEVVAVGAGAAGLCLAALLPGVILVERLPEPGRKILVTGGGRCNVTHEGSPADLARRFRPDGRFVRPALSAFPPARQRAWFESLGVPLVTEPGGFVFPASGRAEDIRAALLRAAARQGARLLAGVRVARIARSPDGCAVAGVVLADGRRLPARRVILAAGGRARPGLGTDGDSLALARGAGLAVAPPLPALGALRTAGAPWIRDLAGLTLPDAVLSIRRGTPGVPGGVAIRGSLLFTGAGLSGPAALDLCGDVASALAAGAKGGFVSASWRADRAVPDAWTPVFGRWRAEHGARLVRNLLAGELPRPLAAALCDAADVSSDCVAARLRQTEARRLAELCAAAPLSMAGTAGFAECMATRGGVAVDELDPRTLESRRVRGLHVVGEAVDAVGPCGGYNLAWAWASAFAAASAIQRGTE